MKNSTIFLLDEGEEKKNLYIAIIIGLLFHLFLIFIKFPKSDFLLPSLEEKKPTIIIIKPPIYKPPEKIRETPKPFARAIPIPDPTPEEPEPIREPSLIAENLTFENFEIPSLNEIPPPPDDDQILIVDGREVMPPLRLTEINPLYTEPARRARVEGYVILQLTIDKEGNVIEVKVLKGLPFGLTETAVEEAKKQKFKPAYRKSTGLSVNCIYTFTIRFQLD